MPPTPAAVRKAGSHFLSRDSPWVARMVAAAALKPGDSVLDAGAGTGSITAALAAAVQPGGAVLAVENEPAAAAALRRLDLPGVAVVEGDVLKVRLPALDAVVSNPPFRILPALLRRLLAQGFGRAVLVMPQELADRLTAQPKTEAYGRLTVEIGLRAKCRILFPLPRKAFDPPPAVACCVVEAVPKAGVAVEAEALAAVLDAAWAASQKTLRHALAPLAGALRLPPQEITSALEATNTGGRPATDVSPWEFGQLAGHVAAAVRKRGAPGLGPQS